jgi:hypothetical protein
MSITVQSDVRTYEDGFEPNKTKIVIVRSHWNNDKMVELVVGTETVRVLARDLQAAIENATNTNRFG